MPLTDFNPEINGFPFLPPGSIKSYPPRAMRSSLQNARLRTLEDLKADYYGAVEVYNLPSYLNHWTDEVELKKCGIEAGKIFLTLDYFNAGLYFPQKMSNLPPRKQAGVQQYLWRRSLDNLQANIAPLLQTLAISAYLPDDWYPQAILDRQIESELRKYKIFQKITITADLGLPPGGFAWSAETTKRSTAHLKKHLTAGRPWPVRLISDTYRLFNNRQVIAYDLIVTDGSIFHFKIYEPDCICSEHTVRVDLSGDRPTVTERCPPALPTQLTALLCESYQQSSPPLDTLAPYQQNEPLRHFFWRLRRWLR